MRGGISDLILHGGKVPSHLMKRMKNLSEVIVDLMVEEYGPEEVVRRLSDPFWFQAFNNVIGMDWDSSGSTSVVLGILKELSWNKDWGFVVLGGKGKNMLKIKDELSNISKMLNLNTERLASISKITARMDSTLLQDGYELYVHFLVVSERTWTVVQQGMNVELKLARRYQINQENKIWLNPHSAVSGVKGEALDLTHPKGREVMEVAVDVVNEGPQKVLASLEKARMALKGQRNLFGEPLLPPDVAKYYYPIKPSKQLENALRKLYEFRPRDPSEMLIAPGLGPRTMRALSLISHLIYGYSPSYDDPVSHPLDPFAYAYAVGGKDGIPYPYDTKIADEVVEVLREIVEKAKIGEKEKLRALRRLAALAERLQSE